MATQNKKIIIIDDDEIISEMYATKFSLEGFEVKTYTNGLSVLWDLINFRPDAILLDIMMPGMNGFEVLQTIKRLATSIKAKIILFSNSSAKENIEKWLEYWADMYLIKAETTPRQALEEIENLIKDKPIIQAKIQYDENWKKYILCPISWTEIYLMD